MTEEQLAQHGMNKSLQHVDFMVGTKDIDIDGITFDGKTVACSATANGLFEKIDKNSRD